MRIGVDVDLTIVDTLTPWLDWFKSKTGKDLPSHEIEGHNLELVMNSYLDGLDAVSYWESHDLYDDITPIPEAKHFIDSAISAGHEIVFITVSNHGHFRSKARFLNREFPNASGIIHTNLKWMIDIDVIIDDNTEILKQVRDKSPHIEIFQVKTQLNRNTPFIRHDWVDIKNKLLGNI